MGVSYVFHYDTAGSRDVKDQLEALNILNNQLEANGAIPSHIFNIQCDIYHSKSSTDGKTVFNFNISDYPYTVFSLQDSNNNLLIADKTFELFFHKLAEFAFRKLPQIECKGTCYKLKDFIIKPGIVTSAGKFKGILVEIEYQPSLVPAQCLRIIKSFVSELFENINLSTLSTIVTTKLNELSEPTDVVYQYKEYFNMLRKIN